LLALIRSCCYNFRYMQIVCLHLNSLFHQLLFCLASFSKSQQLLAVWQHLCC